MESRMGLTVFCIVRIGLNTVLPCLEIESSTPRDSVDALFVYTFALYICISSVHSFPFMLFVIYETKVFVFKSLDEVLWSNGDLVSANVMQQCLGVAG